MADITVSYKGSTIAEVSASGTTTLETAGKYCEDDITLQYVQPAGSSYVKIAEADYTVSTSSTSSALVGYLNATSAAWTSEKIIYVSVRDKAGKRQGYYYGGDFWFANPNPINGSTTNFSIRDGFAYAYNSNGAWITSRTNQDGLYPYDVSSSGVIRLYSRYSASATMTIDGTYHVEVYALSWPDSSPLT